MATCMKFNFSTLSSHRASFRYANEFGIPSIVKTHSLPLHFNGVDSIVRNIFCFLTWLPIINFHLMAIKKQTQKPATSFSNFFSGIKFLGAKPWEMKRIRSLAETGRRRKENPLSTSLPFCVTASRMFFRYFFISLFVKRSEWKQWCGFWCHLLLVI